MAIVSGGINSTSVLEISKKLIYPATDEIRRRIPIWMKFYCFEYSNSAAVRGSAYLRASGSGNIPLLGREKAQILVPAPVNFTTSTAHNYQAQESAVPGIYALPSSAQDVLDKYIAPILQRGKDAFDKIDQFVDMFTQASSELSQQDVRDSEFVPSGPSRQYEIRMTLPCATVQDSKAAGQIVRAFDALSLPTARSLFTVDSVRYFHPPIWSFGIGPPNILKYDPDWSGMPQLCVLKSVSHKQTAYETNALAAVGNYSLGSGNFKPVSYTLTLVFQELEPAFRKTTGNLANAAGMAGGIGNLETGLEIINRSAVILSTGTAIQVGQ